MKKKFGPILFVITWAAAFFAWGKFFSDFKLSFSKITTNDKITLLFFGLFFVFVVYAAKKLIKINSIALDLKNAKDKLSEMEKSGDINFSGLKDTFFNAELKDLYDKYTEENERLKRNLPSGVGCDVEEYFNQENIAACIHDEKLNQMPGTFTGIGMLGTFAGLTIGLSQFNFFGTSDQLAQNINPLMSSIKVAFITSILGLLLSIFFNFLFRDATEELSDGIVSFVNKHHEVAKDDSHNQINTLLEVQVDQRDLLQKFSNSISSKITDGLTPVINDMKNTYEIACDRLKEAQELGMKTLIDEFTKQLIGTLNETSKNLTESVKKAADYQKETNESVSKSIEELLALTDKTIETNKLSIKANEALNKYSENLNSYVEKLSEQIADNTKAMAESATFFDKVEKSTEQLNNISEKSLQYVEMLLTSSNNLSEKYETVNQKINDRIDKYDASFKEKLETLKDIQKNMNNTLTLSVSNLLDDYEVNLEELSKENERTLNNIKVIYERMNEALENSANKFQTITDSMIAKSSEIVVKKIDESSDKLKTELSDSGKEIVKDINEAAFRWMDSKKKSKK